MDGIGHPFDGARDRLAVAVGQEGGDLALVHPGDRVDVEAGLAAAVRRRIVAPRAQLEAASVMACTEDEDVALAQGEADALLARLELFAPYGFAGLEPLDAPQARDVQKDAATHQAIAVAVMSSVVAPLLVMTSRAGLPL